MDAAISYVLLHEVTHAVISIFNAICSIQERIGGSAVTHLPGISAWLMAIAHLYVSLFSELSSKNMVQSVRLKWSSVEYLLNALHLQTIFMLGTVFTLISSFLETRHPTRTGTGLESEITVRKCSAIGSKVKNTGQTGSTTAPNTSCIAYFCYLHGPPNSLASTGS